jgi:ketohexokinase
MAAVLGIGNATLDVIHLVDRYPRENEEVRCRSRLLRRGGNAANTLVVLSQLEVACSWAGVLVDNTDGHFIGKDLQDHGVDTSPCRLLTDGSVPVSTVMVSAETGSRTITHYRDLPEYGYADFAALDLQPFDWLHFEGRNVAATRRMLEQLHVSGNDVPCSVEIEKPRAGIEGLFQYADVLLVSEAYSIARGYADPLVLLRSLRERCPQADLFCTRGAAGALALDRNDQVFRHPAVAPPRVVDTLGAGDTFNAGIISGYLAGLDTAATLARACLLAGRKCGQHGFENLNAERQDVYE